MTPTCPLGECDGSGAIRYVEQEPEDTKRDLGNGLYAGPMTTHGTRLCRCRWEIEPREGHARWWTSTPIYEREWTACVFDRHLNISVIGEVPVSEDNFIVVKRGNRYYPTHVDIGEASFVKPDEARELARILIEAADAADAYDDPDTDEDGCWWFPPEPANSSTDSIPF